MTQIDPALVNKLTEDRRWLHANPELGYQETATAAYVARRLDDLGIPYEAGIAETGIVAEIKGLGESPKVIGLRADMDALPISEQTDVTYRSRNAGVMHACGHDGHTAILMGVAEVLSRQRDFDGTVRLIFQPAEENGNNGAQRMLAEGLLNRFPMDEIYGLHNWPQLPERTVAAIAGPLLASASFLDIQLTGQGAHGSQPHLATPLVSALAQIILGVDGLLAQSRDAQDRIVATLTRLEAAEAFTVIPEKVRAAGSVRCLDQKAQDRFARDVERMAKGIAAGFGGNAEVTCREVVPITTNAPGPAALVANCARDLGYAVETETTMRPVMGSEDFAFFLQQVPGCYFLLGTGQTTDEEPLHSPRFNFNDAALPHGVAMFHEIVRRALPLKTS